MPPAFHTTSHRSHLLQLIKSWEPESGYNSSYLVAFSSRDVYMCTSLSTFSSSFINTGITQLSRQRSTHNLHVHKIHKYMYTVTLYNLYSLIHVSDGKMGGAWGMRGQHVPDQYSAYSMYMYMYMC